MVKVSTVLSQGLRGISEEDVNKLANMCEICALKKVMGHEEYAYYIPRHKSDMENVKNVFVQNGLPAQVYGDALRVNYVNCKDPQMLLNVMARIKHGIAARER